MDLKLTGIFFCHTTEMVLQNEHVKILYDFNIDADLVLEVTKPNIIVVDRRKNKIDVVVSSDPSSKAKEINLLPD